MLPALFNGQIKYALAFLITGLIVTTSTNAQLQANFRADKTGGCTPLTVNFTNTRTGNITGATYRWDFGNGNISTLPNPSACVCDSGTLLYRRSFCKKGTVTLMR